MRINKYLLFISFLSFIDVCSGQLSPSHYTLSLSENSLAIKNFQNDVLTTSIKILKKKRFIINIKNPHDSLIRMSDNEIKQLFKISIVDSFGQPVRVKSFGRWHRRIPKKNSSKYTSKDPVFFNPTVNKNRKSIKLYFWIERKTEDAYAGSIGGYTFEQNNTYFVQLRIKQKDNSIIESNIIKLYVK